MIDLDGTAPKEPSQWKLQLNRYGQAIAKVIDLARVRSAVAGPENRGGMHGPDSKKAARE